jgi:hypothetical protein
VSGKYLYQRAEMPDTVANRALIVLLSTVLGVVLYVSRQQALGSLSWFGLIITSIAIVGGLALVLLRQSDRATEAGQWRLLEDVGVACTVCGSVLLLTGGGGFRILLGGVLAVGAAVWHRFSRK